MELISIYTRKEYFQEDIIVKRFDSEFPGKQAYTLQYIVVAAESELLRLTLAILHPQLQLQCRTFRCI